VAAETRQLKRDERQSFVASFFSIRLYVRMYGQMESLRIHRKMYYKLVSCKRNIALDRGFLVYHCTFRNHNCINTIITLLQLYL